MKRITLLCIAIVYLSTISSAQTIFSENIGSPSGITAIAAYTGWQNNGVLTFSNGGATNPADVRITSVSSGYAGASGSGNVFFTSTSGNYGFSIESINAAAYNTLALQFGYRKENGTSFATFSVEYWDGAAWNVIANTSATLFNEASNAAVGWYLSKSLSLPIAAQINGLKIRFVKSGTLSIRVDDIKLTGLLSSPTTTFISPNSANAGDPGFTLTVNGTNFVNSASVVTWNGANRTTTFVNATQLTAAIPATDISTAGTANVGVITSGAPSVSNTQTFTINAIAGASFTLTSPLPDFGNICINTTAGPSSFTLDGNNLNTTNINIAALSGFSYSETAGGTYTTTLSFSYTGTSFTGKIIYVKFNPTVVQSYNGTINLSGGGVANYPVTATGSGVNSIPSVTTGSSSSVAASSAIAAGTINSIGCGAITAYGIEYSVNSGFLNGTGTPVPSINLAGGNFSSTITGLAPNTRYYYKAYATNGIGTAYGTQQAFTCTALPVPMSSQPSLSFTETFADIANWSNFFITGTGANHFSGLSTAGSGGIPNGTTITASTLSFQSGNPGTSGGVQKGIDQIPPIPVTQSIILLSTGSSPENSTAAAIDFYMDFTGVNAGTLSFDYQTFSNSLGVGANDRAGSLRVYTSIDGTTFTELTFADVLNFINNTPISGSKTNITLPASFNNSPTARLRFYYHNGTGGTNGSRPKISIDNLTVTAVATTPCTAPSAPATALTFGTITDVSIQGSFTAASPAADKYLIVMSTNSSLTGNPINGQNYNLGDNVGDGTVISLNSTTSFTATGLSPLTTYYFFIFPLNSICTGGPLYYTATVLNGSATTLAGLPPCMAPVAQPTSLIFGTATSNSIPGSFTATTADGYLVVRSISASLSANPVNGQTYTVGDAIGNGIVVQKSSSTSFTAASLAPNTLYYFYIFSYNDQGCIGGPVFNITSPLTGSQATMPLPPCTSPVSQPSTLTFNASNTAISGAFTPPSGADDYLVIRSISNTLSATPVDNTDYNLNDPLGGGTVIANSSSNVFLTNNLTAATTYYFFVFAANKNCSGGTKYLTASPLTGSKITTNDLVNNYYFGSLHSHSDYSDGNKDHPGYTPTDDYIYAQTAQCMDFLGISEHNHFSSPDNPGNTITTYHLGTAEANTYTSTHPGFLALYSMEWGVISGGGHVLVYGNGMDNLWGWESGAGGWGGSNNYDVYVPKSVYTGSTGLFKTINDNIATNTFASLAHPNLTDYNSIDTIAYDVVADNAIVASAVESGPALSTNTTYSNPGSSMFYLWYYQSLLSKGYHLGPTIDHDNHNTTFGHTTYSRTAIIAPALTKTEIVKGMRNMHFYATQDCDTKVDFTVNTKIMGTAFSDRYAPVISVAITDATTNYSGAIIRVMFGIPGSAILPVKIDSVIGDNLTYIGNNLANLATGYYYIDISNGTTRIVTSPVWYTRNDNSLTLPVKLIAFSAQKMNSSVKITWTTAQEINTREFIVERSLNGSTWQKVATVPARGNSNSNTDYFIYDNNPAKGQNFYRLKSVDIDSKFDYSAIRQVNFDSKFTYSIYPNPVKDLLQITVDNAAGINAEIKVFNVQGQALLERKIVATSQLVQFNVSSLSPGVYFMKITNPDGIITMEKFIKE